jgi:hypothetical protein
VVVRTLALLLFLAPGARAADVEFYCSFETSPTDCGFREQAKVPGRATLVDVARDGRKAVRLHTEPGDNHVHGSGQPERTDLPPSQAATDCYDGREHWWAHSILFPDDYRRPGKGASGLVADFHHTGRSGQANFNLSVTSEGLYMWGAGGPVVATSSRYAAYRSYVGPLVQNVWYDFVYHVKWSAEADGFFFAWVNGAPKLAYRGPTLYSGMGCYFKLAHYHSPDGAPSSVIHDRVVRGTSERAVISRRRDENGLRH